MLRAQALCRPQARTRVRVGGRRASAAASADQDVAPTGLAPMQFARSHSSITVGAGGMLTVDASGPESLGYAVTGPRALRGRSYMEVVLGADSAPSSAENPQGWGTVALALVRPECDPDTSEHAVWSYQPLRGVAVQCSEDDSKIHQGATCC